MNVDNSKELRLLSFCTGYGGLDIGLKRVVGSVRTVAYAEIDAFACSNLVAKMEAEQLDAAPIWTDLETFPSEEFYGCVDILTAGFPCQPFSVAGLRAGTEDDRHLWPIIERSIDAIRPGAVFFENVPGIISAQTIEHRSDLMGHLAALDEEANQLGAFDAWYLRRHAQRLHRRFLQHAGMSVLLYVINRLESMGYKATAGLFTAAECGAPHKRQRVFILGISDADSSRIAQHWHNAGMGRQQQWPAGPGPYQHSWEPIRTIPHTPRNGRQQGRSEPERQQGRPDVVECGEQLANSGNRQLQESRRRSEERNGAGSTGETLGNSPSDDERRLLDRENGQRIEDRGPGERMADASNNNRRCGKCGAETRTRTHGIRRRRSSVGSQGSAEPEMGGNLDGLTHWMDYAELCESTDSRIDELRLCGNGVSVPQAELAFRTLARELIEV